MSLTLKILQNAKYTARGSYVLRALQGNGLDILVRESIQNSLDAAKSKTTPVKVDFSIKEIAKRNVISQFDESTQEKLNGEFKNDDSCQILLIRDTGTTGLTGDPKDENSKIFKLVYDIGRAQSDEAAGGSWGLGKTIYSNMGLGIVGFFTQTKESGNEVSQKLIFAGLEDEKKVPAQRFTNSPSGIAWWGDKNGETITNQAKIKTLLKNFGSPSFDVGDTGTVIIIPFFGRSDSSLLPKTKNPLPWENDEAAYMKLSIQRWYSNRLIKTAGKSKLIASVNDTVVRKCEPVFKVVQDLRKITDQFKSHQEVGNGIHLKAGESEDDDWTILEKGGGNSAYIKSIRLQSTFKSSAPAGWIAAKLMHKSELKMVPPHNKCTPHKYIFGSGADIDELLPIVAMTRSPQMIVAYDTGNWRKGLRLDDDDEFLVALFVLNSSAELKDGGSLEEYIRGIENPTHSEWHDTSPRAGTTSIPDRIKTNVVNALRAAFFTDDESVEAMSAGESMRAELGKILLPEGFGKSGSAGNTGVGGKAGARETPRLQRSKEPTLIISETTYKPDQIDLEVEIHTGAQSEFTLEIMADTGSGKTIGKDDWGKDDDLSGLYFPFDLENFEITKVIITTPQGKALERGPDHVSAEIEFDLKDTSITFNRSKNNPIRLFASLSLKSNDRSINPVVRLNDTKA
jgi:hypothetical protein